MNRSLLYIIPALLLFSSCEKMEQHFSRTSGSEIVFGHTSTNGADTKASFSGVLTSGYERIDWVAGDSIRIFCPQAYSDDDHVQPHWRFFADYFVSAGKVTSSGSSSSARIEHNPDSVGLRWGAANTLHKFSALCPSPAHGISGTKVEDGKVTCVLPAVQKHSGITYRQPGNKSPLAAPYSKYLYLAGYGSAASDDKSDKGEAVNLYFDPAFTTFEFTLQNDYASGADMTIEKAGISTASGYLAAKYDVKVSNIGQEDGKTLVKDSISIMSDASDVVQMNFSPVLSVAKGDSLTFSLFVQPGNDITKLTFWMVDDNGTKRSFAFKYTDSSKGTEGWVNFTAFHKAKIKGLMVPEGAVWFINTVPLVAQWGTDLQDVDMDSGISFTTPVVTEWQDGETGNIIYTE